MRYQFLVFAICALQLALFCGCGGTNDLPELATVTGMVSLDGEPVTNATVVFRPDQGRPSVGKTDDNGQFTLQYTHDTDGAMLGNHEVSISTYSEYVEPGDDKVIFTPETIPEIYNQQSTLTRTVEAGANEFTFELTSK
ncbi:Ig-like domain-containing protein [Calycomorphotria hydatis]|uniref:Nickel uptake substrate-specific transmembrane region n=1 Tax=Calycomorphotria hydatis TaxID=2528027 RepID=A0A517TDK2_9PLAN|nr:Ig-like domain-containing protein [Calycomorphotria hydatis]QDT66449.1 hypothetical protein V22_37160 [Calycomorphotria hydatis]